MSQNGLLPLTEVRPRAAAALAPASDDDPEVHSEVVDSLTPPALVLVWDDPWLTPSSFGPGLFDAQLTVLAVASRVMPGPGVSRLEELISYTITRLRDDDYQWPQASSQAPRIFEIGGLPFLGARVTYRVPVHVQGG